MKELIAALRLFLVLTAVTGVLYPLAVTGIVQAAFRDKANGSLVERNGRIVGSHLIGQPFDDPKFFWSRPSATGPVPYNVSASSGSNLGPTNPSLKEAIESRVKALKAADPENTLPIPTDLVTASASGLDPHISVEAAEYQVNRVAKLRGLTPEVVRQWVQEHTASRALGILGEPVVNVLELNLKLEKVRK